jgi:hypothetical protein
LTWLPVVPEGRVDVSNWSNPWAACGPPTVILAEVPWTAPVVSV